MEIRVTLRRNVDDYRLARALDLHSARNRNGCCKIAKISLFRSLFMGSCRQQLASTFG